MARNNRKNSRAQFGPRSKQSYSFDSAAICPPNMSWYPADRFPGKCEPDPSQLEKWKKKTRF